MKTLLIFLVCAALLAAQTTHTATLTWTDTQNPAGTTYNVKRATGLCVGTPTFSIIAQAVTVKTYEDATVTPGNFCYVVEASVNGALSPPSNMAAASVPAFQPTALSVTVK